MLTLPMLMMMFRLLLSTVTSRRCIVTTTATTATCSKVSTAEKEGTEIRRNRGDENNDNETRRHFADSSTATTGISISVRRLIGIGTAATPNGRRRSLPRRR